MYIIHEQKQKSNFIITFIYFIVFIILLLLVISPRIFNLQKLPDISRIVLFVVLLVDIVIFRSFFELTFRVTNEGLEFGYGIFKTKISKNNIESVFIDDSKGNFFGYGVRIGKHRALGYIAKTGKGLKIKTKDNRNFFITMNSPEIALDIIKQNKYV